MTPHSRIGSGYVAPPRLTPEEKAELREAAKRIWDPHQYIPASVPLGAPHGCGSRVGVRQGGRVSCQRCGKWLPVVPGAS